MESYKLWISSCVLVVSVVLMVNVTIFQGWPFERGEEKLKVDYVIGILSSVENFEKREIIRRTWLSNVDELGNNRIKAHFILGQNFCDLPESIRTNPYDCEQVLLNESSSKSSFFLNKLIRSTKKLSNTRTGFSFQLNYDLTISRLGALNCGLHNSSNFQISLHDLSREKIIAQINQTAQPSGEATEYSYFKLEKPLEIKRGFIGEIIFRSNPQSDDCKQLSSHKTVRNDNFNLVKVLNFQNDLKYIEMNIRNAILIPAFEYSFTNRTRVQFMLENLSSETQLMKERHEEISKKLSQESNTYKDVKFVDVLDTYRNLPDKVLKFLNFIDNEYHFRYFIKADDDSFLNLANILDYIESNSWPHNVWFGKFRKNWLVNEYGKWSELNYESQVYPPFACGSAYVLSSHLVNWLSLNSKFLFRYQGEDVSMGIWLAAIFPHFEQDVRWNCDGDAWKYFKEEEYFSAGQLSTEDQVRLFKRIKVL